MWRGRVKRCSDTLRLGAQLGRYNLYGPGTQLSQFLQLVGTCMGLNFFEVPRWVVILALFWYLHGWIFPTGTCMGGQKLYTVVHGWAWPHIPWYMDGSLFLQNWYMDGWWVVALQNSQRHTPTQTKVEYPPPPGQQTESLLLGSCSNFWSINLSGKPHFPAVSYLHKRNMAGTLNSPCLRRGACSYGMQLYNNMRNSTK